MMPHNIDKNEEITLEIVTDALYKWMNAVSLTGILRFHITGSVE